MKRMNSFATSVINPLGRSLLAWGFLASGFAKVLAPAATAAYMSSGGLPQSNLLAIAVGVFEVSCAAALVIGLKTRWIAVLLAVFTIAASLLFHSYWRHPEAQPAVQQLFFTKNVQILGGIFLVMAIGGGPWSVDARALRRHLAARPPHAPQRAAPAEEVAGHSTRNSTR